MALKNGHIRWAFDFASWRPTLNELLIATACVQPEEKQRLAKFVFREDFQASLIGRLLMRKFIRDVTDQPYNKILFDRDEKGKPYLVTTDPYTTNNVDFNVSHQGCFAVLAGYTALPVSPSPTVATSTEQTFTVANKSKITKTSIGVDVMKIEYTGGKSLSEFFRLMDRNFSTIEWQHIRRQPSEQLQLQSFMRHWCLKESYVKNIGVGITIDLKNISFLILQDLNEVGAPICNTTLTVNGKPMNEWVFEESLIDEQHCVTVAVHNANVKHKAESFQILQFSDLIEGYQPILDEDYEYCQSILAKSWKTHRR